MRNAFQHLVAIVDGADCPGFRFTGHALRRSDARRISLAHVRVALTYGCELRRDGAVCYAIGRREVREGAREGLDLSRFRGLQVVCTPEGVVMTVYRNDELHGRRPRRRRGAHPRGLRLAQPRLRGRDRCAPDDAPVGVGE